MRIELPRNEVDTLVDAEDFDLLLGFDQVNKRGLI